MDKKNLKNKSGEWFLRRQEDKLKEFLVPRIPSWLETYHLTCLTLVWSLLIILFFYWGREDQIFYFLVPLFVILQYLTDLLDGAVGRYRDTGLVKWGYYADHFLDFIFVSSILFGYGLAVGFTPWLFIVKVVIGAFMVHTFLMVAATDAFRFSLFNIGPTEGRLIFIVFHWVLVMINIQYFNILLPYLAIGGILAVLGLFINGQKQLWNEDMAKKRQ